MPEMSDRVAPITSPATTARPAHPSPSRDGLRLEALSVRELGWWGHRFGIDTPYLMAPLGWGEWTPLVGA